MKKEHLDETNSEDLLVSVQRFDQAMGSFVYNPSATITIGHPTKTSRCFKIVRWVRRTAPGLDFC